MTFPQQLALATRNAHKVREIERICADWPTRWVSAAADPRPWPEVEETGQTYLENALLKARAVADALEMPALADDSGIEADALGGAPGPLSARYAGAPASDERNLSALIRALAGIPGPGRTGRYRCVAAIAWPGGQEMWTEGVCEGSLIAKPRGTNGFGYDPIFVPAGWEQTMAELADQEKDRISHRGRAFRELKDRLSAPD